jgi:hypothetical protein
MDSPLPSLLLIDDDECFFEKTELWFGDTYTIYYFNPQKQKATKLIDFVKDIKPNLVLLDMHFGEIESRDFKGIGYIREIKNELPNTAIITVSLASDDMNDMVQKSGAYCHLKKDNLDRLFWQAVFKRALLNEPYPYIVAILNEGCSQYLKKIRQHFVPLIKNNSLQFKYYADILPGQNYFEETKSQIVCADIILFLLSSKLFAQDNYGELINLVQQREMMAGTLVIPILCSPCIIIDEFLSKKQILPRNNVPISQFQNKDKVCCDISKEIMKLLK